MHSSSNLNNISKVSTRAIAPASRKSRFGQLLNDIDWARLPAAVKTRFADPRDTSHSKVYIGHIISTKMNCVGCLLSRLMLPFGGVLPLDTDNSGAEAIVTVSNTGTGGTQIWTRQYGRPKKAPQIIQSRKQFSGPTGLEEMLGHGIGMTLALTSKDKALLFTSKQYFVEVFGIRLYLPKFLCPGTLTISHTDLGEGTFTFTMTLAHRLFGELIKQHLFFRDSLGDKQ